MACVILGFGTALPESSVTQERAAALTSGMAGHDAAQAERLATLYRRTGIERRYVAILDRGEVPIEVSGPSGGPSTRWRMERYDRAVRPLAHAAAERAMVRADVARETITHLVTVSCTGFAAPGFDVGLIKDLGLEASVERTQVGFMGCHGAINGLRVARALVAADESARVLLCAAELCSLHFQQGADADRAVANALFADGAAALVVGRAASAESEQAGWCVRGLGSYLIPDSEHLMSWSIGDRGFSMTLSPKLVGYVSRYLRSWLAPWLAKFGLTIEQVGSWAVHPGGPRVLDAVEDALQLEPTALAPSRAVFEAHGNMSSPTVLFILDRLREAGARPPCVVLGFGPGLVIEGGLLT